MSKRVYRYFLGAVLAGVLLYTGCSESEVAGAEPPPLVVDTSVRPQIVVVGQSFEVTCSAADTLGTPATADLSFTVEPATTVSGQMVTPTTAGDYRVTCGLADGATADLSPAMVYVITPEQADLVVVDTTLSKGQIGIGETATATCEVALDGALLPDIGTVVRADPETGVTIDDHQITGNADGDFDIACQVMATSFVDLTPARLRVGQGNPPPARIETSLAASTAAAGESIGVICKVLSAAETPLQMPTFVDAPNGVGVVEHSVVAQQVGEHDITCRLTEGDTNVEHVPATLTVVPGPPSQITAWATPQKVAYRPGDWITVEWEAKDDFGNLVEDAAVTVTEPAGAATDQGGGKYELLVDGEHTFTVALDNGAASTELIIIVDGQGPAIAIETPARGMTFDGEPTIEVSGTVNDAFGGLAGMTVNGVPITPDETGKWSVSIDSLHGLTPVLVEATDIHANETKATVAWYYSTAFAPLEDSAPDEGWIDRGLKVWLSQDMIDDYDHTAPIDDLAHLLEILLTFVDFTDLVGEVVLFEQQFPNIVNIQDLGGLGIDVYGDMSVWVDIASIQFGTATLNLDSRDGGLDVVANLAQTDEEVGMRISLQFHVQFQLKATGTFDVFGSDVEIEVGLDPPPALVTTTTLDFDDLGLDTSFDISMQGDQLVIAGQKLALTPEGIHLAPLANAEINLGSVAFKIAGNTLASFNLGTIPLKQLVSGFDQLISGLLDPILNAVVPLVTSILEPLIADLGGDVLAQALQSLEIDQDLDVPELVPGQPPSTITVRAALGGVAFSEAGAMVELDGRAGAAKGVDRNPLGSVLRDGCLGAQPEPYVLPQTGPMELAVGLDFLNEVLFSFWYSGGLQLDLGPEVLSELAGADLPLQNASITLSPLLPPVFSDCNNKGTLRIQLGDAHLDATLNLGDAQIAFEAWLSAEVDVGLVAQDSELGVVVNGISLFQLELYDVQGAFAGNEAALEQLIKSLLDQLLGQLTSGALASFPIPTFDISGLAPGVPAGTVLGLGDLSLKKSKGFLQIEGVLK